MVLTHLFALTTVLVPFLTISAALSVRSEGALRAFKWLIIVWFAMAALAIGVTVGWI